MIARQALPLLVALHLGACHRAPAASAPAKPRPAAGPVDVRAMRALLERYSPTGHYVVSTHEGLPTQFVFGTTTIDVTLGKGFGDYFADAAPENLVDYMSIAVHEVYHAYASTMPYQMEVDRHALGSPYAEAVYVGRKPMLVSYTYSYPARDMDSTFPADARTSRYQTYVSPSQELQSTQSFGAYGMLDELTAYYHSARTLVDFWPWVRDEAPRNEQLLVTYVSRFHEMWVPYAEFRLFILHYLRHARDRHPDVYRALMANEGFRRAFVASVDAYAALLAEAGALEPTIHAFARSRGVNAALRGGQLTYDGLPFTIRDDAYPAVLRHLASADYLQILADLRR